MYLDVTIWHMSEQIHFDVGAVGRKIYGRRKSLGLEQDEVASKAGMSRPYISRLERGAVPNPKLVDLAQVAGALGTSVADLISEPTGDTTTETFRREAQRLLGADNGVALERVAQKLRSKRDAATILSVVATLVDNFPESPSR